MSKRLIFTSLMLSSLAFGQAWSGVLSPARAVDWSQVGVVGGIPNRTTICSTLNQGVTAAQINSAIAACANGVVLLNPGTFTLSAGIDFVHKNNVTLRGSGANQTFLVFTNGVGCAGFGG